MQEERLAELLERYHSGESNAATSRELECVFSIKGIEVRQMVNRLRRKGIPIASSGSGYFYAARVMMNQPEVPTLRSTNSEKKQ